MKKFGTKSRLGQENIKFKNTQINKSFLQYAQKYFRVKQDRNELPENN